MNIKWRKWLLSEAAMVRGKEDLGLGFAYLCNDCRYWREIDRCCVRTSLRCKRFLREYKQRVAPLMHDKKSLSGCLAACQLRLELLVICLRRLSQQRERTRNHEV